MALLALQHITSYIDLKCDVQQKLKYISNINYLINSTNRTTQEERKGEKLCFVQ